MGAWPGNECLIAANDTFSESLTTTDDLVQVGVNNGLDGILTMVASPAVFFNECEINFRFDWRSQTELPPDVNVQVNISKVFT